MDACASDLQTLRHRQRKVEIRKLLLVQLLVVFEAGSISLLSDSRWSQEDLEVKLPVVT